MGGRFLQSQELGLPLPSPLLPPLHAREMLWSAFFPRASCPISNFPQYATTLSSSFQTEDGGVRLSRGEVSAGEEKPVRSFCYERESFRKSPRRTFLRKEDMFFDYEYHSFLSVC